MECHGSYWRQHVGLCTVVCGSWTSAVCISLTLTDLWLTLQATETQQAEGRSQDCKTMWTISANPAVAHTWGSTLVLSLSVCTGTGGVE